VTDLGRDDNGIEDLGAIRAAEFPLTARWAYFDHASDSPLPARAASAIAERVALLQDPRRPAPRREEYLAAAQQRLGRLLGVPPRQLAFVTNLADATALVANGLEWRPGDEVVLVEQEFASFVYPWRALERQGVRLRFVAKDGRATDPNRIEAALTARARVLALSHVEYQHGFRHDLAALGRLCQARGVLLVVDASQSLGVLPAAGQAWGAAAVAAVGYKWLMAPHGIAVLYVAEEAMEQIRPTAPGRYSVRGGWETSDYALAWHPDARRYQSGALNWIGIAALAESLRLLEEVGAAAVPRAALAVADHLVAGLQTRPVTITSDLRPAHRSPIVAFTLGSPEADEVLVARARDAGVVVGQRGMGVRFGAHFWNTTAEVDRLLAVLDGAGASRGG